METVENKVLNYIKKNYQKEKDKWISGLKNKFFEWESMLDQFNSFRCTLISKQQLIHDLMIENDKLKNILKSRGIDYEL